MTEDNRKFLDTFENDLAALAKQVNLAYFNATTTGDKKEFEKVSEVSLEISRFLSDKNSFQKIKAIKEEVKNHDPELKRHVELIYNEIASSQFDEELHEKIIEVQTKVEENYSKFRVKIGDEILTDNQVDDKLLNSSDSDELKQTWEASKAIGSIVVDNVIQLVKMRNEAAKTLGYSDYYEMSLNLNEQNHEELDNLFDELDDLTRDKYIEIKDEIDNYLTGRLSIDKNELMPWHYQDKYFQQGPKIYNVEYDEFFKNVDIEDTCRNYYDSIDLNMDDIIAASDLYERENKYQHAYCTEIDRDGDIRILCNIKPNHKWMQVMLHEAGHAVYDKYVDRSLPWMMRKYSHITTTESIAMLFGRMIYTPSWLSYVIKVNDDEKSRIRENSFKSLKHEQLVFSRWAQVMYRFERKMYENPDQDLNKLWWDLVEKYQMLKRPEGRDEPDWAAKIHLALYPGYYHNYILGELMASQLYHHIVTKVLGQEFTNDEGFTNKEEVGKFLKENFFFPGGKLHWNELIKSATGEYLSPKYYAKQFVG